MNIKKLEADYLKQYPDEENPFNWVIQFGLESLFEFVKLRNGRKVLVKENNKTAGGGFLYYNEDE